MGGQSQIQAPLLFEGEGFAIEVGTEGRASVVVLRGVLDPAHRRFLSAALEEALASGRPELVLELAELSFLDGASAGLIVWARGRLRARHGALTLRHPEPHVAWLIEFCTALADPDAERDRPPAWSSGLPRAEAAAVAP